MPELRWVYFSSCLFFRMSMFSLQFFCSMSFLMAFLSVSLTFPNWVGVICTSGITWQPNYTFFLFYVCTYSESNWGIVPNKRSTILRNFCIFSRGPKACILYPGLSSKYAFRLCFLLNKKVFQIHSKFGTESPKMYFVVGNWLQNMAS